MNHLYNTNNLVFIHSLLEIFSMTVCFSISLYGWKAFDDTTRRRFLWIPFIFMAIGILDLFHFMTYPGMPYFITESSLEKTAWFWVAARSTAAASLLFLLFSRNKKTDFKNKNVLSFFTVFYLFTIVTIIYLFEKELPMLIISHGGPTNFKNTIEYFISFLLLLSLIKSYKIYQQSKQTSDLELVMAISLLLLSELTLTIYSNISDIYVVIGHLIKTFGYFYILKAYFLSSLQLTFYQKQVAEKDLKHTQELLQSFFENTPDSITIMDTTGKVLTVNPAFEKVYGWRADEVKGKIISHITPGFREDINKVVEEVSSGKILIAYETIRQRKDGSIITINMTISPIRNEFGEIVQLASITRDITEQREAEMKLIETERELKDTVRRQQGIIFKYKKQGNRFIHTLCDGQLLYELNYSPDLIVNKDTSEFFNKDTSDFMNLHYEQAWQGYDVSFELLIQEKIHVVTLRPIKREQVVIEVIGSCIDITKLKKTEELLQKSEKLAMVGELAAGLAHEIRNPLTTLKGFTQLIQSQGGSVNKRYIQIMLSELDRIDLITNEFMAVAKPQAIQFQEHDFIVLAKQIVSFSTPQALLKNIEIIEHYADINATIFCEGNQIKQVLINLFKNAIEAMPNGGKLDIHVEQVEDRLQIKIKDTGVGIPKAILPKLGEPFYTLKEKGTGLGLMVSFRIIESHQGTISFESIENEGTTVTITLPLSGTQGQAPCPISLDLVGK